MTPQKAETTEISVAVTIPGYMVVRMRKVMAISRGWRSVCPSLLVHAHGQEVS